jgi:DNA transposition AAA+ family ATPase
MTTTTEKNDGAAETAPPTIDRALQAEASSAHSRINIPLNLENWKALPDDDQGELLWFHQWILDNDIGWAEAESTINYDQSTIFRVLKGIYTGNWPNIIKSIRSFRKLETQRGAIQKSEFAENSITRIIFSALDYALANSSITVIEGDSRSGKTIAAQNWAARNNHGRAVFMTVPVIGGVSALVRKLAERCGISRNRAVNDIVDSLYRAFNKNRILIVDEAHRALPNDIRVVNPQKIEFLRDLHDQTGCAVALLVTARWSLHLKKGAYQYEQLVGRIGMPVRLRQKIKRNDILPIVRQFIKAPSDSLLGDLEAIANKPGRLGIMTETLKAASRIASVDQETLGGKHVLAAIAIRTQHAGGEL